ncbi:MAG: hypothetical protein AAGA93_21410 [Actinomycetota bacterium]
MYAQDRSEVRPAVDRAVRELGLTPDPTSGEWEVRASQSMSTFSWGERIHVLTATNPGGGTQVVVESKLVFGFVDWGRNQRNVESIIGSLDDLLTPVTADDVDG